MNHSTGAQYTQLAFSKSRLYWMISHDCFENTIPFTHLLIQTSSLWFNTLPPKMLRSLNLPRLMQKKNILLHVFNAWANYKWIIGSIHLLPYLYALCNLFNFAEDLRYTCSLQESAGHLSKLFSKPFAQ